MSRIRSTPLALALITTLVLQLGAPVVAYADEAPPPDSQPGAEASAEAPTLEEPLDTPAATEAPATEGSDGDALSEAAPAAAEVLTAVPDGTTVLVLDGAGAPEPMTTPEAAKAILTSDPEWCPGSSAPGSLGCTGSFATVSLLLDEIGTGSYVGNGTIYFTTDYSTNDAYLRGTDARLAALQNLTIDGMGHTLTVPLEITSWLYDVAVTDLTITGAGLRLETEGAIQVSNVIVDSSPGGGAYLDSTGGAASNVAVTGSQFDNSAWTGLDVRSDGDIDLTSVVADDNEQGAYLDASSGSGAISVDNSMFLFNDLAGVTARAKDGPIQLDGVTASHNAGASDAYGAGLTGTSGGSIQVANSNFFGNSGKGVWIEASGPTVLQNLGADGNGLHGAYIHNLNTCAAVPLPATVSGGLYVNSGGYGVLAALGPGGTLTLAGSPFFSGNAAGDYLEDLSPCPTCDDKHSDKHKSYHVVKVPESGGEPVPLDCEAYDGTVLILPIGDRVTLPCPMSGEATLESRPNDGLPGSLPPGRTFLSGVDVGLTEAGVPVQVVIDGSYVTLTFPIPEGWEDASLALLYWDPEANGGAGGWVELPPYALRPDGTPMIHLLHPDASDGMNIQGGVRLLKGSVKVAVNFPGVFVLAAR
jgi:hypothetical protein